MTRSRLIPKMAWYITSTTGVLIFKPTNSDVYQGGLTSPIKVFDGNGGSDTIYFKIVINNKFPEFNGKTMHSSGWKTTAAPTTT